MRASLLFGALASVTSVCLVQCVGDDPAVTGTPVTDSGAGSNTETGAGDGSPLDASQGQPDTGLADALAPTDAGDAGGDAAPALKQAFVTTRHFMGRLDVQGGAAGAGGVAAGDARCMDEAATPFPGRTFHAWLATTASSASTRIGAGPWYVGTRLLGGLTELTTGTLKTGLNLTPDGVVLTTADTVWTGTIDDGSLETDGNCVDWTSVATTDLGNVGTVTGSSTVWTAAGDVGCDATRRLYCFEQ